MPKAKSSGKKRESEPELATKPDKRNRATADELDLDLDLSNDIKGIMSALQHIRQKAEMDGQKKNEETISSVASEIRTMIDELKLKLEKERQTFVKSLSKCSKECENSLKNETTKFQALYEKFCKDKAAHLEALDETFSKFDDARERLFAKYEQIRKKEKSMIAEHEKICTDKIVKLEESLKKKKQDNKTFSILRKSLGSFLETGSDEEDLPQEDDD